MAGPLAVDVDPTEVGLDAARLGRIATVLDGWVDRGRIPGWLVAVGRGGRLPYVGLGGMRHVESGLPVTADTLFRIYSMTKPVTSVAAMSLYEEGGFELNDPVSRYLPALAEVRVHAAGSDLKAVTVPAIEPIRVRHLLTHTSGLTYGFHRTHPSDARLRALGYEWGWPEGTDLATAVDTWASVPLLFQPGTQWNYSVATDVLGRLLEVLTGRPLDEVLAERVLRPLGMTDTAFWAQGEDAGRLARLYLAMPSGGFAPGDALGATALSRPSLFAGGGGLVSSAADYHRFAQMLLRGGELDGVRVLGPRTVAFMTRNHLPGGVDLATFGRPLFAETPMAGVGFGLGVAPVIDPAAYGTVASPGEYSWGGAASTAFWVDPIEDLTVVFMTQLLPSSATTVRLLLRQVVNAAIVGPARRG